MKPTKAQLAAAVEGYNQRRKTQDHADSIRFILKPHTKARLTSRKVQHAAEAYAAKRHPSRWDGPPLGFVGQVYHEAGILAALETL